MKHLFAHNSDNYVKKGDKVKAYGEYIGAIGNADNQYFSHLHYSVSEGLTEAQLKAYVNGWSFDKVNKHYKEPDVDRDKMFDKPIDNGQAGYDWLQHMGKGFHPGRDYNGFGGGNTDMGYKFKSPVDGEVIFAGDWGSGWGKVIIIEEKQMPVDKTYYIKSELRNELKKIWSKFDHESKSSQEKMAGKLEEYIDELSKAHDLELKRTKESLTANYKEQLRLKNDELEECIENAQCIPVTEYSWARLLEIAIKKLNINMKK